MMFSYKYPHAALTTDCVVFGFDGRDLDVLLIERGGDPFKGSWALPGGFMEIDESVEECARRELEEETHVKEVYLQQFHVFSAVDRDPRERVVSVAFFALVRKGNCVPRADDDASDARWFGVEALPPLAFDHGEVIALARKRLQEEVRLRPIAFHLLDRAFLMSELQALYERINDVVYDRCDFERAALASGLIREEVCRSATGEDSPRLFSFCEAAYERLAADGGRNYPLDFSI